MTREEKIACFEDVLNQYENDDFRAYAEDMIELIDDSYFIIPSSTSYKYHNKTQCQPGGHTYHVIMVCTIMNYILGLQYVKDKVVSKHLRDCMRIAALLHDSQKTNGGKHTVHEHPILAKEWILNTKVEHDISDQCKELIGNLVASHSGEWTTSKKSKILLPAPTDDMQFIVHLCDYLGSRSNIDMLYTKEQMDSVSALIPPVDIPDVDDYVFTFGKYKGEKLTDVAQKNSNYIEWCKDNIDREPLKTLLKNF